MAGDGQAVAGDDCDWIRPVVDGRDRLVKPHHILHSLPFPLLIKHLLDLLPHPLRQFLHPFRHPIPIQVVVLPPHVVPDIGD